MRITMKTVYVSDEFRRRLRIYTGESGLATRDEVRAWRVDNGESCDTDLFVETDAIWDEEQKFAEEFDDGEEE